MAQRRKDNYEPVYREKWVEYQAHDFEFAQDKADVDRMARKVGAVFHQEFRQRKEDLRKGGTTIKDAWRMSIGEFADRVPTHDECKKGGTFKKYERNRRASKRSEDEHAVLVGNAMSRIELHKALLGKQAKVEPMEWVAENLYAGVAILSLDPDDIPSQIALNMLEHAMGDRADFWRDYNRARERKAGQRTSLSDSGRSHEDVMHELLAAKDLFETAQTETADVAVGT